MHELFVVIPETGAEEGELSWQERSLCAQTDPGGVLPREGRLHPRGQEGLRRMRGAGRVPRVRPLQRREVRHLGRAVRAGASQAEEARRLSVSCPGPRRSGAMVDPCPTSSPCHDHPRRRGGGSHVRPPLHRTSGCRHGRRGARRARRCRLAAAVSRRDCGTAGARRRDSSSSTSRARDTSVAIARAHQGVRRVVAVHRGRAHRRGRAARHRRRAGHRGAATRRRPGRRLGVGAARGRRGDTVDAGPPARGGPRLADRRHRRAQGRRLGRHPPTRRARHPGHAHGPTTRAPRRSGRPTRGSTTVERTCSPSAPTACSCAGPSGTTSAASTAASSSTAPPSTSGGAPSSPGTGSSSCPGAVLRDAGTTPGSRRRRRRRTSRVEHAGARSSDRAERRALRQVALARCSPLAAPFLAAWLAVSAVLLALTLLLAKRPRLAWARAGRRHRPAAPDRHDGARWRGRRSRRLARGDLATLFVPAGASVRRPSTASTTRWSPTGAPSCARPLPPPRRGRPPTSPRRSGRCPYRCARRMLSHPGRAGGRHRARGHRHRLARPPARRGALCVAHRPGRRGAAAGDDRRLRPVARLPRRLARSRAGHRASSPDRTSPSSPASRGSRSASPRSTTAGRAPASPSPGCSCSRRRCRPGRPTSRVGW